MIFKVPSTTNHSMALWSVFSASTYLASTSPPRAEQWPPPGWHPACRRTFYLEKERRDNPSCQNHTAGKKLKSVGKAVAGYGHRMKAEPTNQVLMWVCLGFLGVAAEGQGRTPVYFPPSILWCLGVSALKSQFWRYSKSREGLQVCVCAFMGQKW